MKLSFFGAAGEVTGSCSLLQINNKKILVDCGAFQGGEFVEERNADPFVFDPKNISAVIITHAHLDHIGRLPLLVKRGYSGFIYATSATAELAKLVLEDAYEVMTYNNKKHGSPIIYELTDVNQAVAQFKSVDYYKNFDLKLPGEKSSVVIKFYDAGHIFGSAFIEINADGKRIVFSGDVGSTNVPILRDTDKLPEGIDLLVSESLYGDRLHDSKHDREGFIKEIIRKSSERRGVLLVPAFSVERTQEILYDLNDLIDHKKELPKNTKIFLDSPLAIEAIDVFNRHKEYFDEKARQMIMSDDDLFRFSGLTICRTRDESRKINSTPGQKIIIAGAGMMNGGRIQHHALRYLSDERTTLFFTGFQAPGTLGRKILDGQTPVRIFDESVEVRCHIEYSDVLSAHADRDKLLSWIENDGNLPKQIVLNHSEPHSGEALKEKIVSDFKIKTDVASPDTTIEF